MLKPKEVAQTISERLGVAVSMPTVYNWIRTGKLPSKKLGGIVLIAQVDLDKFLAAFGSPEQKGDYNGKTAKGRS